MEVEEPLQEAGSHPAEAGGGGGHVSEEAQRQEHLPCPHLGKELQGGGSQGQEGPAAALGRRGLGGQELQRNMVGFEVLQVQARPAEAQQAPGANSDFVQIPETHNFH